MTWIMTRGLRAAAIREGVGDMKSLDTNILLYAADEDCREHDPAIRLVNEALRSPAEWMLADQVLFEMYAGLRHPGVFAKPLPAAQAARRVAFLRDESGFSFCCHELRSWPMIHAGLSIPAFPRRRTYDLVLAVTLRANGVTEFYTRNVVDFRDAGFTGLVNPID
ncbi:MAG: PIN domain-containing protein [Planctomycetota bacterium]